MRNRVNAGWVIGVWLLLGSLHLSAQPVWDFSAFLGASTYLGDLEIDDYVPSLEMAKPTLGLRAGYNLGYRWQLRADVSIGSIAGDDRKSTNTGYQQREYAFTTNFVDFTANMLWEPFARRRFPAKGGYKRILSPYFFAGLGVVRYANETHYGKIDSEWPPSSKVAADKAKGNSHTCLLLPFGGGLRLDVGRRSSLGVEVAAGNPNTDYIDGISQAGNPGNGDWHLRGGLTWSLRFTRPDYDRDGIPDEEDRCPRAAGAASAQGCPDADGDGIEDLVDMCPFQSGALALNGCPDRDGDGIADLIDQCPDVMGDATAEGCPDADGDGLKDEDDRCPETAGLAAMAGCPDTDEDGITDAEDECPNVPGRADLNGCPFPDKDRDGLADEKDKCPNEAGPEALSGCPDTDADGIVDIDDRCPDTLGVAGFSGCPAPSAELLEILKQAAKNVQFETGSAVLKPISVQELTKVTAILQEYPYFHLRISGHTDSQGNDKANQTLSEKRAAACRDQLIANGIDQMRLLSVGFGESHPIANNATPEGRRQNRRVEFELFTP